MQRTVDKFGTISLVVNNAALNRRRTTPLASMEVWRGVMDVNLLASMNLTRLVIPFLIRHAVLSGAAAPLPATTGPAIVYINTNYCNSRQQVLPGIAPVRAHAAQKCALKRGPLPVCGVRCMLAARASSYVHPSHCGPPRST